MEKISESFKPQSKVFFSLFDHQKIVQHFELPFKRIHKILNNFL